MGSLQPTIQRNSVTWQIDYPLATQKNRSLKNHFIIGSVPTTVPCTLEVTSSQKVEFSESRRWRATLRKGPFASERGVWIVGKGVQLQPYTLVVIRGSVSKEHPHFCSATNDPFEREQSHKLGRDTITIVVMILQAAGSDHFFQEMPRGHGDPPFPPCLAVKLHRVHPEVLEFPVKPSTRKKEVPRKNAKERFL